MNTSRTLDFLCYLLLGSSLFCCLSGSIHLSGDDIFIVSDRGLMVDERVASKSYLYLMQQREYLVYFCRRALELLGNASTLILTALVFQLASGILIYSIGQKFLSPTAALVSAIFFVTYLGKEEIIARLQGTQYHTVVFLGIFSLWLTLKKNWNPYLRMTLAGLLLWMSAHFYEVLIVAVPYYALIYIYIEKNPGPTLKKVFPAFIPALFYGLHIFLLSLKPTPLWATRLPNQDSSVLGILDKAFKVFQWGVDSSIGPRYWMILDNGLRFFKNFFFSELRLFTFFFIIGSVILSWKLFFFRAETKSKNLYKEFLLSLSIVFLGPMVSLTIVNGFVPDRFTYVGSVGLAFIVGIALDYFACRPTLKKPISFLILIMLLIQSVSMASRMRQFAIAGDFDHKVHQEILRAFPTIEEEDQFAFLYPSPSEVLSYFQAISPDYLDRDQSVLLWGSYKNLKSPPKMIGAQKATHRHEAVFEPTLKNWENAQKKFYLLEFDNHLRLKSITKTH